METFKKYIRSSGRGPLPAYEETDALLARYPWFTTARVVRAAAGEERTEADTLLSLHLSAAPLPAGGLMPVTAKDFGRDETPVPQAAPAPEELQAPDEPSQAQIIEAFLDLDEHRIAPSPEIPQGETDPMQTSPEEGELPELVTEELADIYIKQQLWPQAKAIYEKLSLLYPKKSVYFAKIIERIDARMEEQNN